MSIRPDLKAKPKERPVQLDDDTPPFDAEKHYANYDHAAVRELSRNTLICPATYNRRGTVQQCLSATFAHRMEAKMFIHDDSSDEYDVEWLQQFSDGVLRHPRSHGGKRGVKNLRSNITKGVLGDPMVDMKGNQFGQEFTQFVREHYGENGPTYLYMVDSDGLHDPHFFYRLHEIMELYPKWGSICLYNAKFHSPKRGKREANLIDPYTTVRGMSAGISMFFRMKSFRDNPTKVQVPDGRGWDGFYSREISGRKVVTSLVSFVEHFGKWGFHNKGNFERDKALHPTKYLAALRGETIKKIEAGHAQAQRERAARGDAQG